MSLIWPDHESSFDLGGRHLLLDYDFFDNQENSRTICQWKNQAAETASREYLHRRDDKSNINQLLLEGNFISMPCILLNILPF